jgi:hypothetical protein
VSAAPFGPPAVMLTLTLCACQAVPNLVGAASGGTVAAVTANPALGIAAGIGARAAFEQAQGSVRRRWTRDEQEAIAAAAAPLGAGEHAPWRVRRGIPIGNGGGGVEVTRLIATPLTTCKELVFSTAGEEAPGRELYTAQICRHDHGWRWASAEPAVARWGNLQ